MAKEIKKPDSVVGGPMQNVALDYKRNEKLIKCGKIAIAVLLVLLLLFSLWNWNIIKFSSDITAIQATNSSISVGEFQYPYIGENGHWYLNGEDSGLPSTGVDGQTPSIGDNGNWFIGEIDTGISAKGAQGMNGAVPYIGANGNWYVDGKDTGVSSKGADGSAGLDGNDGLQGTDGSNGAAGDKGEKGTDGLTPYIGANGNWFIGDVDTGVSAKGAGTSSSGGTASGTTDNGSFTIRINNPSLEKSIALSETRGFSNPATELSTTGIPNAWNITYADIPTGLDNENGGSKNGNDYFVYTFYLKNTGTSEIDYKNTLKLVSDQLGAIKALRFQLYTDGVPVKYAASASDGSKEPFECDQAFSGDVNLFETVKNGLEPGKIVRYTAVIWYEGNDPECVNNILGGGVKMELGYSII